jgi:hypothetical protein
MVCFFIGDGGVAFFAGVFEKKLVQDVVFLW